MAKGEIRIDVKATVDGGGVSIDKQTDDDVLKQAKGEKVNGILESISAMDTINNLSKLGGAMGLNVGSFNKGRTLAIKGINLIKKSADPRAMAVEGIGAIIDIMADLIREQRELAQKQASLENDIDSAKIKSGLLNVQNSASTANWWSGRVYYNKK